MNPSARPDHHFHDFEKWERGRTDSMCENSDHYRLWVGGVDQ